MTASPLAGMLRASDFVLVDREMTGSASGLSFWALLAFPVMFVGFWCAVCYLVAFVSGWRRLAAHYATDAPITGQRFRFRSAKAGFVRFRSTLNLAAAPDGLHLWLLAPFRVGAPHLLVPWHDVAAAPTQEWMFKRVALTFAREPGISFQIGRTLGEEIAAASQGALRIGSS
jgi:hypothetical protein